MSLRAIFLSNFLVCDVYTCVPLFVWVGITFLPLYSLASVLCTCISMLHDQSNFKTTKQKAWQHNATRLRESFSKKKAASGGIHFIVCIFYSVPVYQVEMICLALLCICNSAHVN